MTAVTRGFVTAWGVVYMAVAYPTTVYRFANACPMDRHARVAAVLCGPKVAETFREGEWPERYQDFRIAAEPLAAAGFTFKRRRLA